MAEIGILGGSGLYELLEDAEEQVVDTPYGAPSDAVVIGAFAGFPPERSCSFGSALEGARVTS